MGGQTLLNYELTTEPFPLRASTTTGSPNGKFTIVASNPNPEEPVTIKEGHYQDTNVPSWFWCRSMPDGGATVLIRNDTK